MTLRGFLFDYGVKVPGYDVGVVNEREIRAGAGIMGLMGMIVIFVGIGYNHIIVARVFLTFMFIDFTLRIINPNYAPSLLLGRFMVRNQKPEYVGALQKRFAWTLGWFLIIPMIQWFVLNWDLTFYKVLLCVLCLVLTFLESVFSICVGCKLYKYLTRLDPKHCPGGVCELETKDPVQRFNPVQKFITIITFIGLVTATYLFLGYTESKTFFGDFLHDLVLTSDQIQSQKDAAYEKSMAEEFGDDF